MARDDMKRSNTTRPKIKESVKQKLKSFVGQQSHPPLAVVNCISIGLAAIGLILGITALAVQILRKKTLDESVLMFIVQNSLFVAALVLCSLVLVWMLARKDREAKKWHNRNRCLSNFIRNALGPRSEFAERLHRMQHNLRDLICEPGKNPFEYSEQQAKVEICKFCKNLSAILRWYFGWHERQSNFHVAVMGFVDDCHVMTLGRSTNNEGDLDDTSMEDFDKTQISIRDTESLKLMVWSKEYCPTWASDDLTNYNRKKEIPLQDIVPLALGHKDNAVAILCIQKLLGKSPRGPYELAGFLMVHTKLETPGERKLFMAADRQINEAVKNLIASFADMFFTVLKKGKASLPRSAKRLEKSKYYVDTGNLSFIKKINESFVETYY